MTRALEILAAALLLALAVYLALLTPGIRIAPYDLPGELSVLQWPREMAALICAGLGLWLAAGSWGGCPGLRPVLVGAIVLAQVPVLCAVWRTATSAMMKGWFL
jgi:hypothetical protein